MEFLRHRIGDERMLRLIQKWLNAGVIEDGEWSDTGKGTPPPTSGYPAVISPLLSNVFLHYVFDQWIHQWRSRHACGPTH
jgi:retron-type reverse transcriptase